jgi:TonB family protein
VEVSPREISGFVQVVFTVQPDGTVSEARVFGAVPAGYYEEQALERVRARSWEPGVDADGNIVARQATEVIEFTLPADTPRRSGTVGP